MNEYPRVSEGILGEEDIPKTNTELFLEMVEQYFPEAIKDGEVDFTALKEEMGEFHEVGPEHYDFTWAGKQAAKKEAQADIFGKSLRYKPQDSLNPDTTENLYIEGDNLEALKLLRRNYHGKIKMIYIDPPYNTGSDFIYNDDTTISNEELGDISKNRINGHWYEKNTKDSSLYHTKWLNLMYPRLKLARELLSDDGVIFISIDYNEQHNLRKMCDEIFGANCFVCSAIWKSSDNSNNDAKQFSTDHNDTLIYSKSPMWQPQKLHDETKQGHFKNPNNDPKGPWFDGNPLNSPNYRENLRYTITAPNGNVIQPPKNGWRWSQETLNEKMKSGEIYFNNDYTNIKRKTYLCDTEGLPPSSLWTDFEKTGHNRQAKYELLETMPENVFDTPKPTRLIKFIISLVKENTNAIILDFFSGSGTTADAVMQLNSEDSGTRKYILIQLPENLDYSLLKAKKDKRAVIENAINLCNAMNVPHTLSEIGKERIRRAAKKIHEENPDAVFDDGFKVFEVGNTTIRWNTMDDEEIKKLTDIDLRTGDKDALDFTFGHNDIDVVYEIMLRQYGIPLSTPIEKMPEISERTYIFADAVVVCLEPEINDELIEKLANIEPTPAKFILRDSAFNDDIELKDFSFRKLTGLIRNHQTEEERKSKYNNYTVEFI